ncbi:MAG: ABC transporter ATP-binding protein/permease [Clostridia bacterium]|nr:ABC transporter ATP-binding protein/permease [Clostridia bacterium]
MRNNINYGSKFKCYLSKVKFLIATLVFFGLTLAAFSLAFPILWANIITSLTGAVTEEGYGIFLKYLMIYIGLELAEGVISLIKNYIYANMEDKVTKEIKRDVFNKVVSLEVKAFDRNKVSYFTQKITEEPHNLVASFYKLTGLVITILKTVAVILIAFATCFDCGLVFSFALLVIYLTISNVKPFLARGERQLNLEVKEYSNSLFDTIRSIREIKILGAKSQIKKDFDIESTDIEKEISGSRNMTNLMDLLLFSIRFSIHALVLVITTRQYFAGLVEFETIVILELYSALLFNGAKQIAEANNIWMLYKNSLKNIFDVLTNKNYNNEKFGMIEETKGEGDLIVKNVSFELGNGRMILDDINFDVLRNSKVAITDKGGNTKQILLKLLTRQYEPSEGRIMIDNVNIRDLSEAALRRTIMIVSEKTFILNDTLENNIRIVKPNATLEEVAEACAKVDILKWFDNDTLGEVMNVRLGDGGYPLTEVQKELISIARVFLASPKIVIVEDSQTDLSSDDTFALKVAIDKITDSTLLVFSDRISSISVCDEIIALSISKYGSATVEQDYIKERNFYGFLQSKKKLNRVYDEEESVYHKPIENKTNGDNNAVEEIQKLNAQKGAYQNEEHRIFSQIWGDIH